MSTKQPAGLISVLFDPTATLCEQDDAAMDLYKYDEPEALLALVAVATDPNRDELIQSSAGESIGQIWRRSGGADQTVIDRMTPAARTEAEHVLNPRPQPDSRP